ncbi:MAG: hypothetical protein Q8R11_02575 [bacterium]|nr:hypothetical protein [bacterium]
MKLPHFQPKSDLYDKRLKPMLNSKTGRSYTELGLTFLALLVFGWFAIRPTLLTIFTLRREYQALKEVTDSFQAKIDALSRAQTILTQAETLGQNALLAQAIPPDPDVGRTALTIERIATKNRVRLQSIRLDRAVYAFPKPDEDVTMTTQDLTYTLTAVGPERQLLAFTKDLHTARRLFVISTMTISSSTLQLSIRTPSRVPKTDDASGQGQKAPEQKGQILEK